MKKELIFLLLISLTFAFACNQAGSSDQASEEATEQAATDETTDEAAESVDAEKANRPSPPRKATGTIGGANITIDYSSPAVKGREIWGGLVAYDKVWRTGANEATTFETSADVMIEGQALAAGKYALFTIPGQDKWTVIFNTVPDQWGAGSYDEAKDALRVEVTPQALEESVERLEFVMEGDQVVLRWEKLAVPFKVAAAG